MDQDKVKLGYKERDKLFQKYFSELKIKVALNWFELCALMAIFCFVSFKLIAHFDLFNRIVGAFVAVLVSVLITIGFCVLRKYKLAINRFDKERIYKRVSSELLDSKEEAKN